jgi:hypothetical protein
MKKYIFLRSYYSEFCAWWNGDGKCKSDAMFGLIELFGYQSSLFRLASPMCSSILMETWRPVWQAWHLPWVETIVLVFLCRGCLTLISLRRASFYSLICGWCVSFFFPEVACCCDLLFLEHKGCNHCGLTYPFCLVYVFLNDPVCYGDVCVRLTICLGRSCIAYQEAHLDSMTNCSYLGDSQKPSNSECSYPAYYCGYMDFLRAGGLCGTCWYLCEWLFCRWRFQSICPEG